MCSRIVIYEEILGPLKIFTEEMSSSQSTTIDHVAGMLCFLFFDISLCMFLSARLLELRMKIPKRREECVFDFEKEFRDLLLSCFDRKFGCIFSTVNVALLAAALSPRYGKLEFVSQEVKKAVWKRVEELALLALYKIEDIEKNNRHVQAYRSIVGGVVQQLQLC